jgi:hypothetical protein
VLDVIYISRRTYRYHPFPKPTNNYITYKQTTQNRNNSALCQPHTIIRIPVRIQCPSGHRISLTGTASNSKGEDEDHDLRTTVKSGRGQEVVLPEPSGPILAEVVLGEDGEEEGGEDGGVDTDGEVAKRPAEDGGDDLVGAELGPLLVDEPEGDGNGETDDDGEGHDLGLGEAVRE